MTDKDTYPDQKQPTSRSAKIFGKALAFVRNPYHRAVEADARDAQRHTTEQFEAITGDAQGLNRTVAEVMSTAVARDPSRSLNPHVVRDEQGASTATWDLEAAVGARAPSQFGHNFRNDGEPLSLKTPAGIVPISKIQISLCSRVVDGQLTEPFSVVRLSAVRKLQAGDIHEIHIGQDGDIAVDSTNPDPDSPMRLTPSDQPLDPKELELFLRQFAYLYSQEEPQKYSSLVSHLPPRNV